MEWKDVQKFHLNPHLVALPRIKEIDEEYELQKKRLKNLNKSLHDHILSVYFSDPEILKHGWVIAINRFPYNLAKDLQHLVLWIHPERKFSDNDINGIVDDFMKKKGIKDYIFFCNLPNVKSINTIVHYQIIIKNPNTNSRL